MARTASGYVSDKVGGLLEKAAKASRSESAWVAEAIEQRLKRDGFLKDETDPKERLLAKFEALVDQVPAELEQALDQLGERTIEAKAS